jgi:hypothetical protein
MRIPASLLIALAALSQASCSPREARQGGGAPARVEIRLAATEPRAGMHLLEPADGVEPLYVSDEVVLSNANVLRAQVVKGPLGDPAVEVGFDSAGRKRLAAVTSAHAGEKMAIFLDGRLTSAMTIRDPITGGTALITGDFTRAQARDLAKRIMARGGDGAVRVAGDGLGQTPPPFTATEAQEHPELAAWLKVWTPPLSPLNASSFRLISSDTSLGFPITYVVDGDSTFPPRHPERLVSSPDSTWGVDCWYDEVDAGGVYRGDDYNPVALLNRRTGQAFLIGGCGVGCASRVAVWLDVHRLLVAGTDVVNDPPFDRVRPAVSLFDLRSRRKWLYAAPPIDSKFVRSALQAEWDLWQSLYPWLRVEDPERP